MDYLTAYKEICEVYTKDIDFINNIENRLERLQKKFGYDDENKLLVCAQSIRDKIENIKLGKTKMLMAVTKLEIATKELETWENKN